MSRTKKTEQKSQTEEGDSKPHSTAESIMASLSMQGRSTSSLAPADHTVMNSKKASTNESKSSTNENKSLGATGSLYDNALTSNRENENRQELTGHDPHTSSYSEFLSFASSNLPVIPDPSTATNATISEAMNKLYVLMQANFQQSATNLCEITGRFQSLETKIDSVRERQSEFEDKILHKQNELDNRVTKQSQQIDSLESDTVRKSEYDDLKARFDRLQDEINERFQLVADDMINLRLDSCRNASDIRRLEERVNVHDIRAKKFSFIIEGFPEIQGENLANNLVTRFNSDANANLSANDFLTIRRVGKTDPKNRNTTGPRPIAIVVCDEDKRSKLLSCRGKLSKNLDSTIIWINEELPPTYRRRKAMLRDLVKLGKVTWPKSNQAE